MSDSQLNKEFSKADVQRMRNLMTGKANEATKVVTGHIKQEIERKEGDIWEEDGRQWTIKNGIKQNISKLQTARKLGRLPLFCPECKGLLKDKYDEGYFKHFNHCWGCHLKFERKLKVEGKWEDYVKEQNNAEVDALIEEFENWALEMTNAADDSFFTEMGTEEKWTKSNKGIFEEQKQEAIEFLKKLKR